MDNELCLGGNGNIELDLNARMANRHGLIAGATGTGKTITLQVMAEAFSRIGVPVFMADVKGDLSGLAQPGVLNDKIQSRMDKIGLGNFTGQSNPVLFWDIFRENGHPVRTTISEIGPLMLSNLLELNDTQTGVLYSTFDFADDNGLLLLDFKDLRAMLNWMAENSKSLPSEYGNISGSSVGAIQRKLLILEEQGAEHFFGEPALKLDDLMITDFSGRGVISILDVTKLMTQSPRLYSTFLLWLLAELFEQLPEVGDADKPKLVLFFDEAHMLFDHAPRALLDKIEQVVRLIRSKGVGVYFITQSPLDLPMDILGQLGMRVQHALRAFTPRDKKAVKTVAETFRQNPSLDTETVITELGTGEALVSILDNKGSPTPVERILIRPPESRIGPLTRDERNAVMQRSPFKGRYDEMLDRESAYEQLKRQAENTARQEAVKKAEQQQKEQQAVTTTRSSRRSTRQTPAEAMITSAARSIGSQLGRRLIRGLMGSLLGSK
ncbi:helicase HerA-like domain-containing protein [Kaarinaea lacus]